MLIFPEGRRSDSGEIDRFRPGIGMIASRLNVPVVPVRIEGLDKVLHHTWRMASPGRVRVAFGAPLTLTGEDYEALARRVEEAVQGAARDSQGELRRSRVSSVGQAVVPLVRLYGSCRSVTCSQSRPSDASRVCHNG